MSEVRRERKGERGRDKRVTEGREVSALVRGQDADVRGMSGRRGSESSK